MIDTGKKVAEILLDIKSVSLRPNKPFHYSSGILSPVYTDCRLLISHPDARKKIINLYVKSIKELNKPFDIVAGTSTAGIPHAAWIAHALNLPMIYVRGNAKDHGKGNKIEGVIKKGQTAVIIEDLISTGKSSIETASAIRRAGAKANYVFSIVTYGMKSAEENFKQNKLKLVSLASFQNIVATASQRGDIKVKEQSIVLDWATDPPAWGKKMGFE